MLMQTKFLYYLHFLLLFTSFISNNFLEHNIDLINKMKDHGQIYMISIVYH